MRRRFGYNRKGAYDKFVKHFKGFVKVKHSKNIRTVMSPDVTFLFWFKLYQ